MTDSRGDGAGAKKRRGVRPKSKTSQIPRTAAQKSQTARLTTFGADAQNEIGHRLQALYDELLQQPLPTRLTDLLLDLEHAATKSKTKN